MRVDFRWVGLLGLWRSEPPFGFFEGRCFSSSSSSRLGDGDAARLDLGGESQGEPSV